MMPEEESTGCQGMEREELGTYTSVLSPRIHEVHRNTICKTEWSNRYYTPLSFTALLIYVITVKDHLHRRIQTCFTLTCSILLTIAPKVWISQCKNLFSLTMINLKSLLPATTDKCLKIDQDSSSHKSIALVWPLSPTIYLWAAIMVIHSQFTRSHHLFIVQCFQSLQWCDFFQWVITFLLKKFLTAVKYT